MAHVWNSFSNSKPDYFNIEPGDTESVIPDAQWLHEGGADMMTYKAVIANDLATPDYLKQKVGGYYQNCQQALGRGAQNNAAQEGRFRDYYDCGFVIGLVTDLACQKMAENISMSVTGLSSSARAVNTGSNYICMPCPNAPDRTMLFRR